MKKVFKFIITFIIIAVIGFTTVLTTNLIIDFIESRLSELSFLIALCIGITLCISYLTYALLKEKKHENDSKS